MNDSTDEDKAARTKQEMAGVFDRGAPTYDQTGVAFFGPMGRDLVRRADLRPGERVLDVGCGRGAVLLPAADAVGPTGGVVGIDLAPTMVELARADVAAAGLAALTRRPPVLLTGDNPRAAARLAAEVGLHDIRAGLLPAEKVAAVHELQSDGTRLLAVGDGINDAPALAAAHVGIAMGRAGSDLIIDVADAVVVRDDLTTVPAVVALSRRARRYVVANLTIAATAIVVLASWDILGTLPLPLAVAGHEGSTVLVALNGLRLLRRRAWPVEPAPSRRRATGRPATPPRRP